MDTRQYHEIAELDESNWWYRSRKEVVRRALMRFVQNKVSRGADIGCGTGAHAELLQSFAHTTIALDPSIEALEYAKKRGYSEVVQSGAESLPLTSTSLDLCLVTDVLEHVDDSAAVRELHRTLVSGGYVCATVPAYLSLWNANDDHSHHLRRYRKAELVQLFEGNGFEVLHIRHWNRLFFMPVWVMARMYKKPEQADQLRNNLSLIPPFLNNVLTLWMNVESVLFRYVDIPGVSLVIIAKKK